MSLFITKTRADLTEVWANIAHSLPQVTRLAISMPLVIMGVMLIMPPARLIFIGAAFVMVGFLIFDGDGIYRRYKDQKLTSQIDREIELLAYELRDRESINVFKSGATYFEANQYGRFETLVHPKELGRLSAMVVKRYEKRDSLVGRIIDKLPPTPAVIMIALIVFIPLYTAMKNAGG